MNAVILHPLVPRELYEQARAEADQARAFASTSYSEGLDEMATSAAFHIHWFALKIPIALRRELLRGLVEARLGPIAAGMLADAPDDQVSRLIAEAIMAEAREAL